MIFQSPTSLPGKTPFLPRTAPLCNRNGQNSCPWTCKPNSTCAATGRPLPTAAGCTSWVSRSAPLDPDDGRCCCTWRAPAWERGGALDEEARAAMSLSRLWQQQGKRQEAYELLAPIYGWFTEGFDTADLQEA